MSNPFDTNGGGAPQFGTEAAYSPPNTGAWQRNDSVPLEDDEPFTAAHLAAANEATVPAVSGSAGAAAPPPPSSLAPPHTALVFTGA